MNQIRQRGASYAQNLGGTGNRQVQLLQNFRPDEVARMWGFHPDFAGPLLRHQ